MENKTPPKTAARYRPTLWAGFHRLCWSAIILALWPVAALFRGLEKLRRYV
jgi:hypothetical protein